MTSEPFRWITSNGISLKLVTVQKMQATKIKVMREKTALTCPPSASPEKNVINISYFTSILFYLSI